MSDNITAPAAGTSFATDEIANVHYPRTKIGTGADGTYNDVSTDNPLPVAIVSGGGSGGGGGGGDASAANQATEIARLTSILSSVDGLEGLLATVNTLLGGTLTVALPAGAATNAGIASALAAQSYYPTTQPVSGTFFQATQPISATALPLPAGAATAVKQDAIVTALGSPLQAGGNVAVTASALPTGAATSAKQDLQTTALQNSAPADDLFAITPSATALATVPKALLVTGAGTLAVGGTSNTSVSLGSVTVGQVIPLRARYVYATGTTATVVGLV